MVGVPATESTLKGSHSHGCIECGALSTLSISTLVSIDVVENCGYRKTSIQRWVSNKRPGLLEIQSCQSTSHTLVTS